MGAALVGTGVAAGALVRRVQQAGAARPRAGGAPEGDFAYDVSEFEATDPKLLLYQPAGAFDTGFGRVKRLALAPDGGVLVAGDRAVRRFDPAGVQRGEIKLERPPHGLQVTSADEVAIIFGNHFEIWDLAGRQKLRSARLGDDTFLTAIGVLEGTLYLADAGRREILMCDRRTGEVIGRFGRRDEPPGAPGLVVPSPYLDLAVGAGRLHVANPGRLRVETYTLDGRYESAWGGPGMAVDRFCGCCNPVYFVRLPDGRFLTSEKGLARINVYGAAGEFQGAVAGPLTLVDDKDLARRACADCRLGGGFDVACGDPARVFVLDPFRKSVRVFRPRPAVSA